MKEETQKDEPKESIDKDLFLKALGLRLTKIRTELDIQRGALAKKSGVSKKRIADTENGKGYDIRVIIDLVSALGIDLSRFMLDTENLCKRLQKEGATPESLDRDIRILNNFSALIEDYSPK